MPTAPNIHGGRKPRIDMRPSAARRGYDRDHQAMRKIVIAEEPVCACGQMSTEVDHIIPLVRGGSDDRSNLRGCCRRCNARKGATSDRRDRSVG